MKHQTLSIVNHSTHVITAGQGEPPLILLHGGGIDSATLSWGGILEPLAQSRRVIAFDWPGYGESELPDHPVTAAFLVDFLACLMDTLEIKRASLMGISMGGAAALGFTLAHPHRVETLALVDSYGLQARAPWHRLSWLYVRLPGVNALTWAMMRSRAMAKATLGALLKRPGALTEEVVELAYQAILRPNADRAWASYQRDEMQWQGTRTCYLDRLGELNLPVLIIHGEKDTLVPQDCIRAAHERIAGSQLAWIEGSGHWPQRDHPQAFLEAVQGFFHPA